MADYNKEPGDSECAPLQAAFSHCGSAKQHTVKVWSLTHLAVSSAFFLMCNRTDRSFSPRLPAGIKGDHAGV